MAPYIYGRRNLIHIINLRETLRGVIRASHFLENLCADGGKVLYVGTKKQIAPAVEEWAGRAGMPFVTDRWIGGLLTNYATVHKRVDRLDEIERITAGETNRVLTKKETASVAREKRKILRNLAGVRSMDRLPTAVVLVDPKREVNALTEAAKLEIPTIGILDTDCDPEPLDITIPANDEAMKSVSLLLGILSESVMAGKARYEREQAVGEKEAAAAAEIPVASGVKAGKG
jgi:small subunit ribosomal protein S2